MFYKISTTDKYFETLRQAQHTFLQCILSLTLIQAASVEHAFEDDFSQSVVFKADFSNANFAVSATSDDSDQNKTDNALSQDEEITADEKTEAESAEPSEDFKVPLIPDDKVRGHC